MRLFVVLHSYLSYSDYLKAVKCWNHSYENFCWFCSWFMIILYTLILGTSIYFISFFITPIIFFFILNHIRSFSFTCICMGTIHFLLRFLFSRTCLISKYVSLQSCSIFYCLYWVHLDVYFRCHFHLKTGWILLSLDLSLFQVSLNTICSLLQFMFQIYILLNLMLPCFRACLMIFSFQYTTLCIHPCLY